MSARRYPLANLMAASGLTEAALARKVGLSGSTLKYVRENGLAEVSADRYAVRAGLHPHTVWPEMVGHVLDEVQVACASTDCGELFVPRDGRGQQRYCSARCRQRESTRRYRATEGGAESARRVRRTYYWSDPRIREREAAMKAKPSARRAEAARRRQLRAERRTTEEIAA